ncbi:YfdQ family protein [Sodalis ligni]|uniref:Uncharacterized protein YfdQ (DUF2303 family) n=1 Tax=Sodalis ligni TaxID=2697027 RepID=A0A4R1NGN4_9GAMM|nr:DUF2303 family protein [Sodalis ligni]TCL06855.1 uncharacterized protein YfdQ (DUF2303 family) [Sodalis ligni]
MPQTVDASAITQIRDLVLAGNLPELLEKADCPVAAVPEGIRIQSLESLKDGRYRFRGKLKTASIPDFVRYCKEYATSPGVRCFIDADEMSAATVFNLGTLEAPGHADNIALLKLKKTAPFAALLDIDGRKKTQKELAEWLEDWNEYLLAFSADGEVLDITKAVAGVRQITIESVTSQDHEEQDFSGKRSLMQSVEAKSKVVMPAAFEFQCTPFEGLPIRRIKLRYSILTGGDIPVLVLRIVQLEAVMEQIAGEFRDLLVAQFNGTGVETFIGDFSAQ